MWLPLTSGEIYNQLLETTDIDEDGQVKFEIYVGNEREHMEIFN